MCFGFVGHMVTTATTQLCIAERNNHGQFPMNGCTYVPTKLYLQKRGQDGFGPWAVVC